MLEKIYIGKRLSRTSSVIKHIYTLLVVVIGWAFFYFEDLANLKNFFRAIFFQNGFSTKNKKTVAQNYIAVIIIGIIASLPIASIIKQFAQNISASKSGKAVVNLSIVLFVLFSLTVSTASLIGDSYNPFLYFQF